MWDTLLYDQENLRVIHRGIFHAMMMGLALLRCMQTMCLTLEDQHQFESEPKVIKRGILVIWGIIAGKMDKFVLAGWVKSIVEGEWE